MSNTTALILLLILYMAIGVALSAAGIDYRRPSFYVVLLLVAAVDLMSHIKATL